jgi:hypothetical protein
MQIYRNPIYLVLIGAIALLTAWYSGSSLYWYYQYTTLSSQAPATINKWNIITDSNKWSFKWFSDATYLVEMEYSFIVDHKQYTGRTVFSDEKHRNPWAAEQRAVQMSQKPWTAWYNPSHPNHSALQKYFPFKECISAVILWGVLLYFIWLGSYVKNYPG